MSERGVRAFVGLGSNLGDRCVHLETALGEIAALPCTAVLARSSFYESAPFEAGGGDYVNAVAELQTTLDPLALLRALQSIEAEHGRERPLPMAPRTLDLDLLLYGDDRRQTDELTRCPIRVCTERAFVLLPLAEIAPGLHIHAGRGRVDDLLHSTGAQRVAPMAKP